MSNLKFSLILLGFLILIFISTQGIEKKEDERFVKRTLIILEGIKKEEKR